MAGIDRVNPLTAAGLAFLLQPWVLVTAGVATITQAKISTTAEWVALFAFCLLCSASYLAMETYAALRPAEVKSTLASLLRVDQVAPRPGDRVPVPRAGPLPHGQEHRRAGAAAS